MKSLIVLAIVSLALLLNFAASVRESLDNALRSASIAAGARS